MTIFMAAVIYAMMVTGINAIMPSEQHQDKACVSETSIVDGIAYTSTTFNNTCDCAEPTVSVGWGW